MGRAGIIASARHAGGAAGYVDEVLADTPALYWRLGESSGTVAADASGNSRTGTYEGSYTQGQTGLAGDANTCVDFTGGDVFRTYEAWQDDTTFTVEAIIRADSVSSYKAVVNTDGVTRGWNLYVKDGKLHVYNFNEVNPEVLFGATTLSTGVTYHVAFVSNGTTQKVYLNGVEDGSATQTMPAQSGTNRLFMVGASVAGSATIESRNLQFDGKIDEVAYYSTALSAARLLAHADAAGL